MIVKVLEIFSEYISIIFCLTKIVEKKICINREILIFFIIELCSVLIAEHYREEHGWIMIIVYSTFLIYTKTQLCAKWRESIKVLCIMIIVIPSMQLIVYFATKFSFEGIVSNNVAGIFVNCINIVIIMLWKKDYLYWLTKRKVKSSSSIIILLILTFLCYFLYMYKNLNYIYKPVTLLALIGIIGVGIISILWLNAENEKRNKTREIQLYQLYNKTFEEAITAIRVRQHEFDNHINAIKCLQLTIDNQSDLVKAQNEYCDKVLKENSFNRLLKLQLEPILTGFLYSKFMNAKEQGIDIVYEIHTIKWNNKIEINELIEIMGILLDNAVEALGNVEGDNDKKIIVRLFQESEERFFVEVANRSKRYLNSQLEKFCEHGYSTKGQNRGMGLSRVKEIAKKCKAEILIENIIYNENSYLSFKVIF